MPSRNVKYRSDIIKNRMLYKTRINEESEVIADYTWSHHLFMCYDDCGLCCVSSLFPCITFGMNAAQVEMGRCCPMAVVCLCPILNCFFLQKLRTTIRIKYGIAGSALNDFLLSCCFPICIVIQEAQELRNEPAQQIARTWEN